MQRTALVLATFLLSAIGAHAQDVCPGNTPAPKIVSPADGATAVPSPVTYQWTAVTGATGYQVWASDDGVTFTEIGGTSDTQFVDDVPPATGVEWYVVATFDACYTQSAHAKFQTAGCGSPPSVPVSPPNGANAVSSPVTFQWIGQEKADGYRVYVTTDGENYDVVAETSDTHTDPILLTPGVYGWTVETSFSNCESSFSDLSNFTIPRSANCPTAAPSRITPADGSTQISTVTFGWNAVPNAIGYELWVQLDGGDFSLVDTTSGTQDSVDLGTGQVAWYIVAQFNGCDNLKSDTGSFDIPVNPDCDHNSAYLITPSDGDQDVPLTTSFIWTPVDGSIGYKVWASFGGGAQQLLGQTTATRLTASIQAGDVDWWVETLFANCPSDQTAPTSFVASAAAVCTAPRAPDIFVDPQAMSGDSYLLIWNPGLNTASYEVAESTKANFSDATLRTVSDILLTLSHTVTQPTRYYYRIRSQSSCGLGFGPYSDVATIVITPSGTTSDAADSVASYGTQSMIVQTVHIPGSAASGKDATLSTSFAATVDKPWLTVTPSSGTIPPEGIDLKITADPRNLPAGSSDATLHISTTTNASSGSVDATHHITSTAAAPPASVPVTVNLVAPVTPNAGNSPLPNSLIIPAVAHGQGVGTVFESDIRVANVSAEAQKYLLSFTPSGTDGTKTGFQSTIQINPGETTALNDLLKNFYGFAASGDSAFGVLEIRPLTSGTGTSGAKADVTFASSRTYATTPNGTYGQFIPAIPFASFIDKTKAISLQQISQTADYRTNIGLVEGAGQPATVLIKVFDSLGQSIGTFTKSLMPGEHQQFALPAALSVANGRLEVDVTSATGKVTAYASVIDNRTNDPMMIMPVQLGSVKASRFVLPGIADLNTGQASWRSDIRLFNGGTTPVPATISYYPQEDPGNPRITSLTINPNEMKVVDSALQTLFSMQNTGGSVVITTPADAKLVATARTYNQTGNGTYGQFIPGVLAGDGVGPGERALQILQVEESDRFRTNVGIFELTGKPVTVEISIYVPDSKVVTKGQLSLSPNQFKQLNSILSFNFGLPATYNARVAIRVIGGTGRVSGYASLIDRQTQDPTYVPAQ
jgi:hypothetical protein